MYFLDFYIFRNISALKMYTLKISSSLQLEMYIVWMYKPQKSNFIYAGVFFSCFCYLRTSSDLLLPHLMTFVGHCCLFPFLNNISISTLPEFTPSIQLASVATYKMWTTSDQVRTIYLCSLQYERIEDSVMSPTLLLYLLHYLNVVSSPVSSNCQFLYNYCRSDFGLTRLKSTMHRKVEHLELLMVSEMLTLFSLDIWSLFYLRHQQFLNWLMTFRKERSNFISCFHL